MEVNITVKLPDAEPFGVIIATTPEELMRENAMMFIWEPAINQLKMELEDRLAVKK